MTLFPYTTLFRSEGVIGLSRGAPCAANRRRWRRHYGGHAEEPREGFDPGFTGEMRGREGGEQVGDGLGILDLQGHGIIVAWASPARRHGARTPSSTVEEREGKENLRKPPCPLLNKLRNGPAATLAI